MERHWEGKGKEKGKACADNEHCVGGTALWPSMRSPTFHFSFGGHSFIKACGHDQHCVGGTPLSKRALTNIPRLLWRAQLYESVCSQPTLCGGIALRKRALTNIPCLLWRAQLYQSVWSRPTLCGGHCFKQACAHQHSTSPLAGIGLCHDSVCSRPTWNAFPQAQTKHKYRSM